MDERVAPPSSERLSETRERLDAHVREIVEWHFDNGHRSGVWKEFRPILVVEVISPGQATRDLVEKREDYWVAGVEEYWIADPTHARLIVLTRGATEWDEQSFDRPEQRYAPSRLPGLEIEIGALFGS